MGARSACTTDNPGHFVDGRVRIAQSRVSGSLLQPLDKCSVWRPQCSRESRPCDWSTVGAALSIDVSLTVASGAESLQTAHAFIPEVFCHITPCGSARKQPLHCNKCIRSLARPPVLTCPLRKFVMLLLGAFPEKSNFCCFFSALRCEEESHAGGSAFLRAASHRTASKTCPAVEKRAAKYESGLNHYPTPSSCLYLCTHSCRIT